MIFEENDDENISEDDGNGDYKDDNDYGDDDDIYIMMHVCL